MRAMLIGLLAVGIVLAFAFGGCRGLEEGDEVDPEHDGGTDTDADTDSDTDSDSDSDSDGDSDSDCDLDELPDIDDVNDCPMNWGWPSMCEQEYCDNGVPCLGWQQGGMGACASLCQVEDPPTCPESAFGMEVVELCNSYIQPDGCMCLLSGCEEPWDDCPFGGRCVAWTCARLQLDVDCEEGEGETKVCFPYNW